MIESLSIKNFLSFKNEVKISFEASKETHLEDIHVVEVANGVRLRKLGILYGYNASGKSNLIDSFQFLKHFWFAVADNKDETTGVVPFLLDHESRDKPSNLKLVFYCNKLKYVYYLSATEDFVINERLDFYPTVQPANIFDRNFENGVSIIDFGKKIKVSQVVKDEITLKCLPNISVFAALNQINVVIKELNSAFEWMKNQVMQSIGPLTRLQEFAEQLIIENNEFKQQVLSYLKEADFNISRIDSQEIDEEIPEEMLKYAKSVKGISKQELERLEKEHTIKMTKTEFGHSVKNIEDEEVFSLPIEWQSEGTRRIFGISGAILKTIENQAFLSIDEIESKLHPRLIEYVLENFLRKSERSQLLVATHYDNLFDEVDLLRKDNFWFTEKGEDGSTNLYPLSGFNGLNRISSLQKAYKYGKFGAVPNID